MKVLHIITDLGQGGAERVLFSLISSTLDRHEHRVVSLHGGGVYAQKLLDMGVPVEVLDMPRGRLTISGFWRLLSTLRCHKVDVIQTRLYHADLVGGIAAFLTTSSPVVWGVHSIALGGFRNTWKTRVVRQLCSLCSYFVPTAIVVDAQRTALIHGSLGYAKRKIVLIHNGVDLSHFSRDGAARDRLRNEWGIQPDTAVFGLVARWHPLKDHANLFRALAIYRSHDDGFLCVLAGVGMSADNGELMALICENGLAGHVRLLGPRSDIGEIMSALDLHVLSSSSESLPVAVIEAMACETPCVVTDVGDAAVLVGNSGWVAPPSDSAKLARAISEGMQTLRTSGRTLSLGESCRQRVVTYFSLANMADRYTELWKGTQ